MKFRAFILITAVSLLLSLAGKGADTALSALKLLPKDVAKRLVRIEAREGELAPERWYLLVYDPTVPSGLREYVVAAGKIVADRTLSQFADALKPEEVIGADKLAVDSERLVQIAKLYAEVNQTGLGSLDFQLALSPLVAAPRWRVICLDPLGDQVGILNINATTGEEISHDGFGTVPDGLATLPPVEVPKPTVAVVPPSATPPVRTTQTVTKPKPTPAPAPKPTAAPSRGLGDSMKKLFGGSKP